MPHDAQRRMPVRISRRAMLAGLAAAPVLSAATGTYAEETAAMHVVLLGDSVFDNAAYVAGGPDVLAQMQRRMPSGWRATLLAIDGDVISGVSRQLAKAPADATHLAISVGGNDALGYSGILSAPSRSIAESLSALADIRQQFEAGYAAMLDAVLKRKLPTAVCTIYDPRYPDTLQRRIAVTALTVINDAIIRVAAERGVPLIDLRLVCNDDADFANPIEPSVQGGWKIAGAITSVVGQHDFARQRAEIFVR